MVNVVVLAEASGGEYRFIVDGKPPAKSCGAFAIAEITPSQALFHVYSRARVSATGALEASPQRLFTREIPLTPLRA